MRRVRHRRWIAAAGSAVLVGTGGVAWASIPDAGGVIHTCYVKLSLRVIDSDAGAACKPKENALDIYSKAGADAAFLGKTAKAADADTVDGLDSTQLVGPARPPGPGLSLGRPEV